MNKAWLQGQLDGFLQDLSNLLGPRDSTYYFSGIEVSPEYDDPHVAIAPGTKEVCVRFPNYTRDTPYSIILCHLAHECVHLLDPVFGDNVTVLEEGLAAWYGLYGSDRLRGEVSVRDTVRSRPYVRAKDLIVETLPFGILNAIKTLRTMYGLPIHRIGAADLRKMLPDEVCRETLDKLASKWNQPNVANFVRLSAEYLSTEALSANQFA